MSTMTFANISHLFAVFLYSKILFIMSLESIALRFAAKLIFASVTKEKFYIIIIRTKAFFLSAHIVETLLYQDSFSSDFSFALFSWSLVSAAKPTMICPGFFLLPKLF